ncbi:MAG: aldehyde dehydrogenase family protein [Actinomycetota bacterium]|nr:aldehyde dehydrogenase family protein [Actinomycetota bacterium]
MSAQATTADVEAAIGAALTAAPGWRELSFDDRAVVFLRAADLISTAWRDLTQLESKAPYALTGAVFAQDRAAIAGVQHALRFAAGNFYVNDKPTGAVVGQQPFGGARASGTNDKAGSIWNLLRWTSPRALKETFAPATDYRYPHMGQPGSGASAG